MIYSDGASREQAEAEPGTLLSSFGWAVRLFRPDFTTELLCMGAQLGEASDSVPTLELKGALAAQQQLAKWLHQDYDDELLKALPLTQHIIPDFIASIPDNCLGRQAP